MEELYLDLSDRGLHCLAFGMEIEGWGKDQLYYLMFRVGYTRREE